MSLSRRKFMKVGVVAAACAALPLKSALGQNGPEGRVASLSNNAQLPLSSFSKVSPEQLGYYTEASFAPYVNTQFRVYLSPSNTRGLKLIEVSDYLSTLPRSLTRGNSSKMECFSLLLTLPPGKPFEQDTYLIEHEALGTFYLFMVPVNLRSKTALEYYEAVIYRHPGNPSSYDSVLFNDTHPRGRQGSMASATQSEITGTSASGRNLKTDQEVFYFRPKEIKSTAVQTEAPGAAGRRAASKLAVAQAPDIGGLKLGMSIEQVLALFPGIKDNAEVRASLSGPASPFGDLSLIISPENYSPKKKFDRVSQIVVTFLDGRVSTLIVSYDGPMWEHVDGFVAKYSAETKLPAADSWDAFVGMDTQLKTLRCKDFEVSVFAGGNNVNINYVQLRDMTAQQKLKERKARARMMKGTKP